MMNAILMAVVRFFETVVNYTLGAALVALAVVGALAVSRRLLAGADVNNSFGRAVGALRRGSGSLALAAVLVAGLACLLAGLALWAR